MGKDLLYLSQKDVSRIDVDMQAVIDAIEVAMIDKGHGLTGMPPKTNVYVDGEENYINAMPGYIPSQSALGLKWVSAYPKNPARGLPYVNGLIILNDPETGIPRAVMDAVWVTTYRTGAATALSAKYLAKPTSKTVGILGCGVQGRSNVEALCQLFDIETVFAYDVDFNRANSFAKEINQLRSIEIKPVKKPKAAVTSCDIVVTAGPITKPPHATIGAGWLEPGTFASLVDYDAYWHPGAFKEIDLFCTDDTIQFLKYKGRGYFTKTPDIHADLGELTTGSKSGRQNDQQRTMAANLGNAIFDMAVAVLIFEKAKSMGVGRWLPI